MQSNRFLGARTAVLGTTVFVLALQSLNASPDAELVAQWWPATAVATALLLQTPRRYVRSICGYLLAVFVGAGLLTGQSVLFTLVFALANVVEAVIVLWWLTHMRDGRPAFESWLDYRRWLTAIALGSLVAAVLTSLAIWATSNEPPWRTLMWVTITHLGAQTVILPLAVEWPRQRVRVSIVEGTSHILLAGIAVGACVAADRSDPVAFLLLPVLMWAAARFPSTWANLELLATATGIAVLTALGSGPFEPIPADVRVLDIAASPQAFVAVSGITAVAFAVAMGHLRDSLRTIRENELQLGELVDSASGTAFIATDLDGTITLFSPGAEKLLGYSASEIVGRTTPMRFHEPHEIQARADELGIPPSYAAITKPLDDGAEQDTRDWAYIAKDRSRLTVSLSATAVRDQSGRAVSYLSIVRDVSNRRAAEQALVFALDKEREANQRMQELDQAKGEFVSAVSHELRTPLTSIVGYTELLSEGVSGDLTSTQLELIERIDRNGGRLLTLVEDLLTLARIEDGDFEMERVQTDLRDAVRAGTTEFSCAASSAGVTLTMTLPPEPVLLDGDPTKLERLVVNLVGNAVKFTDAGGLVDVTLEVEQGVATLIVSDSGMGIPHEEQGRLFQRFFRSSLATRNAIQGTGLGLNIVRSIAEVHDGEITFDSEVGEGTTFRFTVPLCGSTTASDLVHPEA